jgi:hypothetical protein
VQHARGFVGPLLELAHLIQWAVECVALEERSNMLPPIGDNPF